MRKIIYRTILLLTIGAIIIITYLSIFGIETDKFNNQISSKINNINPNIKVELKKIKLILKPLDLKIKAKKLLTLRIQILKILKYLYQIK